MARAESYAYTVDDANGETLDGAKAYTGDQDPDGNLTPPGMMLTIYQACIMQAVDTPARVQDRIETTGAVDGQQTDSWDQYSARWTYQPEEGLTLTVWEA